MLVLVSVAVMMVTGLLVLAKSTICVFPPRTIFGVVTATTTATDTNGTSAPGAADWTGQPWPGANS